MRQLGHRKKSLAGGLVVTVSLPALASPCRLGNIGERPGNLQAAILSFQDRELKCAWRRLGPSPEHWLPGPEGSHAVEDCSFFLLF